jgi:hypothetical protein
VRELSPYPACTCGTLVTSHPPRRGGYVPRVEPSLGASARNPRRVRVTEALPGAYVPWGRWGVSMREQVGRREALGLLAAAVAGILAAGRGWAEDAQPSPAAPPKHLCKGLNACKGQGNCKHGCSGHGCKGQNDCRGKGGCASVAASHECAGKNQCRGIGGCGTGDRGCAGRNSCKGKGGCEVPLKVEHAASRRRASPK